jgi:hypothetical protein
MIEHDRLGSTRVMPEGLCGWGLRLLFKAYAAHDLSRNIGVPWLTEPEATAMAFIADRRFICNFVPRRA